MGIPSCWEPVGFNFGLRPIFVPIFLKWLILSRFRSLLPCFLPIFFIFMPYRRNTAMRFYVPRQADQTLFSPDLTQPAQGELPEFHHRSDDAEDWFHIGLFKAAARDRHDAGLFIGVSPLVDSGLLLFYVGAAALGIATGAVETFEPVLTSYLVRSGDLSGGMGLLSMSRALGLFVSNIIMGVIFTADQPDSYLYACITAVLGAGILVLTERWLHRQKTLSADFRSKASSEP